MPIKKYSDVADGNAKCEDMHINSQKICAEMEKAIGKGDCSKLKSKLAKKACEGSIKQKKQPSKAEKTSTGGKSIEWKQCTFEWAEKKCYNGRSLEILKICGTKRIRDYAKCFDIKIKEGESLPKKREACITEVQERAKNKAGANSPSLQCFNKFMEDCYGKVHKETGKKSLRDKHKNSELNKQDFCRLKWHEQKNKYIDPKAKGVKRLIPNTIGQCKISG